MHITWGGVLFLIIVAIVVVGIFMFSRWRQGKGFSIPRVPIGNKKKSTDDGLVLCLNVYNDRIVREYMLEKSVCTNARQWSLGGKQYILQGNGGSDFGPLLLPVDIIFPPERLARMIGCEPLKKLKSLKYNLLEQLAPFTPVIALGIGALLFIIVLGE